MPTLRFLSRSKGLYHYQHEDGNSLPRTRRVDGPDSKRKSLYMTASLTLTSSRLRAQIYWSAGVENVSATRDGHLGHVFPCKGENFDNPQPWANSFTRLSFQRTEYTFSLAVSWKMSRKENELVKAFGRWEHHGVSHCMLSLSPKRARWVASHRGNVNLSFLRYCSLYYIVTTCVSSRAKHKPISD